MAQILTIQISEKYDYSDFVTLVYQVEMYEAETNHSIVLYESIYESQSIEFFNNALDRINPDHFKVIAVNPRYREYECIKNFEEDYEL